MERYTSGLLADFSRKAASELGRGIAGTKSPPPQPDFTAGPRQLPSATPLVGFSTYGSPKPSGPKEVHT